MHPLQALPRVLGEGSSSRLRVFPHEFLRSVNEFRQSFSPGMVAGAAKLVVVNFVDFFADLGVCTFAVDCVDP